MAPPPSSTDSLRRLWQRLVEARAAASATDADVFRRTWFGLGVSVTLVALFYNLLAHEADQAVQDKSKARLTAAAKKKHERDSTRAREDTIRHELAAALRQYNASGNAPDNKVLDKVAPAVTTPANTTPDQAARAASAAGKKPVSHSAAEASDASAVALHYQVGWLLRVLGVVGLGVLAWGGWQAGRYFWPRPAAEPTPKGGGAEQDPELLHALLKAFAGQIGQVLPNPRQVKRFAAKARLQNNLLIALRIKSKAQTPPFLFGKPQQVLAFLLLLLIEQETSREDKAEATRPAGAPAAPRLRDLGEQDFVERLPVLFSSWYRTGDREMVLGLVLADLTKLVTISCKQLVDMLAAPAGQALLVQLHRLNTGLLV